MLESQVQLGEHKSPRRVSLPNSIKFSVPRDTARSDGDWGVDQVEPINTSQSQ